MESQASVERLARGFCGLNVKRLLQGCGKVCQAQAPKGKASDNDQSRGLFQASCTVLIIYVPVFATVATVVLGANRKLNTLFQKAA